MLKTIYNLATDKHRSPLAATAKFFLYLLSLLYRLIIGILVLIDRKQVRQINCRVISVGNITLGGTGKTSLVEFIARYLRQEGHKVAILSRGYKRRIRNRKYEIKNTEHMGDEPYMLTQNLKDIPVLVDADRIRSANSAISNYGVDTVILDDGFQQWRIKKDLEIVTIDATNPFGNRNIIPRGILREPLSALRRADVFVLTKTNLNFHTEELTSFLNQINPSALLIKSIHEPQGLCRIGKEEEILRLDSFSGKTVTLVSGIADPYSFENLITTLGINIGLVFRFPDHYPYSYKDLRRIIQESEKKNIDTVITTEKDAVRLKPYLSSDVTNKLIFLTLPVKIKIISDEQKLFTRLHKLYSS